MIAAPQAPDVKSEQPDPHDAPSAALERRCIVTATIKPRTALIRCVIGPDGRVCPDLDEKLPGRGLWVSCDAQTVAEAVRKNAFSRAARAPAEVPPDLVERIAQLLRARVLQLLGLSQRSKTCVTGFNQVLPAVRAGEIEVLFVASDAGHDGVEKLQNRVEHAKIFRFFTSQVLGHALGHDQLVYAGLRPHALTEQILTAARRFSAFLPQETIAPKASLAQIDRDLNHDVTDD